MKKLYGLATAAVFLAGSAGIATADGEGPHFTFGASTSYVYDINDPDPENAPSDAISNNRALYSSFEQDESFNIDLVQLGVTGERGPVMYGAKIDLGDLAAAAGDSSDGDIALQEAYLGIDASGFLITAGRFGTPIGYEVLEPWGNAHISRSRAWQAQPINHDGVTVSHSISGLDLMLGVVNGFTVADPAGNNVDDEYGILWAAGTTVGDLWLGTSGIYTEEGDAVDTLFINAIASGTYGSCRYGIEGNYRDDDPDPEGNALPGTFTETEFWDITLYGGADLTDQWSADLRFSYSDIEAQSRTFSRGPGSVDSFKAENEIWSVTATVGYEITPGVTVRGEYRHDDSDDNVFADDDSNSSPKDSVDVLQLQLLWTPELD